jgi:hypothetical protein
MEKEERISKEILKYLVHRDLCKQFEIFCHDMLQGALIPPIRGVYRLRRAYHAVRILPEQEIDEVIAHVERDIKNKYAISDEVWNIFQNESLEEWKAYQKQIEQRQHNRKSEPSELDPEGPKYIRERNIPERARFAKE